MRYYKENQEAATVFILVLYSGMVFITLLRTAGDGLSGKCFPGSGDCMKKHRKQENRQLTVASTPVTDENRLNNPLSVWASIM